MQDDATGPGTRRPAGRLLVGLLVALSLALTGWNAGAVSAGERTGATVDEMLEDLGAATGTTPAQELVPVGVLIDDNGTSPGGIRVERVEVPAADADEVVEQLEGVAEVRVASVGRPVSIASDPLGPQQYGTNRIRANLLPSGVDGTGMTVAIIDTGVSGSHPDLQPVLSDGRPRVASGATFLFGHPDDFTATGNVDPHGHGTHAAGVISAARGNGVGIAGLAPGAQILPVRALGADGAGNTVDLAIGIDWAYDRGADVISLSLSGQGSDPLVRDLLARITTDWSRGKAPPVVIAAAGNAGMSSPVMYPAAYSSTIAVAASNSADDVASFSSRGAHINVAAPGVGIVSTWPVGRACPQRPAVGYCTLNGTSMATPHVAAVVALLRGREPGLSAVAVRTRLESTAHDISILGRDRATGAGRIDAAAAVLPGSHSKVPRIHHPPSGVLSSVAVDGARITVRGRATDREGPPRVRIRSTVNGRVSERVTTAGTASGGGNWARGWNDVPGTHRVCVHVLDNPFGTATSLGCREVVVK